AGATTAAAAATATLGGAGAGVAASAPAARAHGGGVAAELGRVLGGEGQHALAREAGALLDRVDVEDHGRDLVALVEVLRDVLDVVVAQLADVDQALDALFDLHEHAEVGDAGDRTGDLGAGRVAIGEAAPRVGLGLAQTERDPLLLGVQLEDHRLDGIALGEDLLGVADALGPAHLADVDEALEARLDLDERAERGEVGDRARDALPDGVVGEHVFPRVGRELLHGEVDALALEVHVEDLDLDLVTELDDVTRVREAAVGQLGAVHQPVDPAEVDEDPEVGDLDDLALELRARLEALEGVFLEVGDLFLEDRAARDDHAV